MFYGMKFECFVLGKYFLFCFSKQAKMKFIYTKRDPNTRSANKHQWFRTFVYSVGWVPPQVGPHIYFRK